MKGRSNNDEARIKNDSQGADMTMPETLEEVLRLSKADDCIVIGFEATTANIRWANNSTTTNGVAGTQELYVISIINHHVGVVGQSYFPGEKLAELVRRSEAACEQQEPAEDYIELISDDLAVEDWYEQAPKTDMGQFKGMVAELAKAFSGAEQNDVKLFGFIEHSATALYLATSKGVRRRFDQLQGHIAINAKSPDFKRSSWVGQGTKNFEDVDIESMYQKLKLRLEWSKTKLELPAGRYETLLEPAAVADMVIYQYFTSVARDSDEGRTVFSKPGGGNRVGEKLFNEDVSIYSDPKEPGFETAPFEAAIGSSSYQSIFDNGLGLSRTDWIKDGVLANLITTRHWAKQKDTEPKPFIGNLIFDQPEGSDLNEMIAKTKRGLLVTCFWYIREVDPQRLLLTGLTRDGVFLIEDGKVKGAVNNFRYNMSPVEMLAQTTEIGQSVPTLPREWGDFFTLCKMPPLRVKDFNMSTVSQAN